jgi:hypothetical protein
MNYDLKDWLNAANDVWEPVNPVPNLAPNAGNFHVKNNLPGLVGLMMIDNSGHLTNNPQPILLGPEFTSPNNEFTLTDVYTKSLPIRFRVFLGHSGSFIGTLEFDATQPDLIIDQDMLIQPNHIGDPPKPGNGMIIPTDGPKICVGLAKKVVNTSSTPLIIVREQYWKLTSESHVLDAGEVRSVSFRTSYGVQDSSSEQQTVAASLSLSASAGWGMISASISGSFNTSSTTTHSLTITSNTEKYETFQKENKSNSAMVYFLWQMMDEISVYSVTSADYVYLPMASIVLAQQPCILKSYPISDSCL